MVRAVGLRRPAGQLTARRPARGDAHRRRPTGPVAMAALERQAILDALRDAAGNKQAAADHLGLSRSTLYRKMSAYSI